MNLPKIEIDHRFRLQQKIGKGSFGCIYSAIDILTNTQVAVKIEPNNKNEKGVKPSKRSHLYYEGRIYYKIKKHYPDGISSLPTFLWCGFSNRYDFLVLPLYSINLRVYLKKQDWNRKNWSLLAKNSLEGVQDLHRVEILHRDIKPENFVFNTTHTGLVLIDFGLSQCINSSKKKNSWVGTPKFASPWIGENKPYTYLDDLSSWWIMMLWCWNRGKLPWTCKIGRQTLTRQETRIELNYLQQKKKSWLVSFFNHHDLSKVTTLPTWFIDKGKRIHQSLLVVSSDYDCCNPLSI